METKTETLTQKMERLARERKERNMYVIKLMAPMKKKERELFIDNDIRINNEIFNGSGSIWDIAIKLQMIAIRNGR